MKTCLFLLTTCLHHVAVFGLSQVEYRPGSSRSNIILTVPHGGGLLPSGVKQRDYGCWRNNRCVWSHTCGRKDKQRCKAAYLKDSWTLELALNLARNLERLTGNRPHLIINNIHRSRMDANRDIELATFGVAAMKRAFNQYHGYIREAKRRVGTGLLFDIHGQAHKENWIELGYRISRYQLRSANNGLCHVSSIRHLAFRRRSCVSCLSLIRGSKSLGGYLDRYRRYRVVPSPSIRSPMSAPYFAGGYYSGGYTVWLHGSLRGGSVDAIQIESPKSLRNADAGPLYAVHLATAIRDFITAHKGTCQVG